MPRRFNPCPIHCGEIRFDVQRYCMGDASQWRDSSESTSNKPRKLSRWNTRAERAEAREDAGSNPAWGFEGRRRGGNTLTNEDATYCHRKSFKYVGES